MGTITHNGYTFKVIQSVNDIPAGYRIWNIGKNMVDGYIPFCRLALVQPFPGGCAIDPDALLALPCDRAQDVLAVTTYGPQTPKEMKTYIKKHSARNPGICFKMEKAIPVLESIGWRKE